VPQIAREVVESRAGCKLVLCGVLGPQPSGIDYDLQFDSGTLDFSIIYADRTAILAGLMRAFAERGIVLAYPTQTSFTAAPDGTLIMPYPHVTLRGEAECDSGPADEAR